jgi:Ni/Fe-hydrogenase 1 B-type cytochrome subunit
MNAPIARTTPVLGAAAAEEPRVRVYVWDLVVRTTHWVTALAIVLLTVSGIYIGRPFIISSGPATQAFVMGWMKVVHFYAAIAFTLAVLARIAWMFMGSRDARWSELVPVTLDRLRALFETLKFYLFLRSHPPPARGHNALAGAAYAVVFGLYLVMIGSGLALYGQSAGVGSPMRWFAELLPIFGGAQTARWLHHVGMWVLIVFVVQHVYSAWLTSRVEKNGTMDSIFTGYKFVPRDEARERHD